MTMAPPTDDRRWHARQTPDGSVLERCYPLGWNVGIVCDVDPATGEYWTRWRGMLGAEGAAGSLEQARLCALEAAEKLLTEALQQLRLCNRRASATRKQSPDAQDSPG